MIRESSHPGTLNPPAGNPVLCRSGTALLLTVLLSWLSAPAQALDLLSPFKGWFGKDEGVVTWQEPGQFVKIVDQDWAPKHRRAPANDHPANLDPSRIAVALASLHTWAPKNTPAAGRAVPVFTTSQVALLSGKLAEALARAQRDQDVVFAVEGVHEDLGTSTRKATAGRVFMQDGAMNFIFGDLLVDAGDGGGGTSQYAKPHRAGKRMEPLSRDIRLAAGPGMDYWQGNGWHRADWLRLDLPVVMSAYRGPRLPAAASAARAPVPVMTQAAPATGTEDPRMREEITRLRRELEGDQAPVSAPAAPAAPRPLAPARPAPAAPARPAMAARAAPNESIPDIEQRLSTLKSLHDKKLITDQEYDAKRKEILADF